MSDIQNITNVKILPKVVETVFRQNFLFSRIASKTKKMIDGSEVKRAVRVTDNNNITPWSGMDNLSHGVTNNTVTMRYTPKKVAISVELADDEIGVNASNTDKVVEIINYKMEEAAYSLANYLGTQMYTSDGVANTKVFTGLAGIVDDGSTIPLIGGVDRTVYTTLKSTVTPSGGTITLAMLDTFLSNITEGSDKPTVMVCNDTVFNLLKKLIQPLSYNTPAYSVGNVAGGLTIGGGATAIKYNGVDIVADKKAPAQTLYGLNENYLDFYTTELPDVKPIQYSAQFENGLEAFTDSPKGLGFVSTDKRIPYSQMGRVWYIHFLSELVSFNSRMHGKLTGITTA